jgi:beta-glucuronidase
MKLSVTRWLQVSSLLVLSLGISQLSLAAELPLQAQSIQAYGRDATSLNGEWKIIVDPYENGYYNYRYEPFDQQEKPSVNAFFTDSKQKTPSDLIEYDFDKADTLQVPGDWNTQKEKLYYYEGSVWYRKKFDAPAAKKTDRQFIYFGAVISVVLRLSTTK